MVAGYDGGNINDVEIIDLSVTEPNTCTTLPNYPVTTNGNTAAYLQDRILSCDTSNKCYVYNPVDRKWSDTGETPTTPNQRGKGMTEIGGVLLISGGEKTETWDGSNLSPGPDIPVVMREFHCQATVNDTHVFFANAESGSTGETYLLNWETKQWTQLAELETRRSRPSCGIPCGST